MGEAVSQRRRVARMPMSLSFRILVIQRLRLALLVAWPGLRTLAFLELWEHVLYSEAVFTGMGRNRRSSGAHDNILKIANQHIRP